MNLVRSSGELLRQDNDLVARYLLFSAVVHKIHPRCLWPVMVMDSFDQLLDFHSMVENTVTYRQQYTDNFAINIRYTIDKKPVFSKNPTQWVLLVFCRVFRCEWRLL